MGVPGLGPAEGCEDAVEQDAGEAPDGEVAGGGGDGEGRGLVGGWPAFDGGGVPVGGVDEVGYGNAKDLGGFLAVLDGDEAGFLPPGDDGGDQVVADGEVYGGEGAEDLYTLGVEAGFFNGFAEGGDVAGGLVGAGLVVVLGVDFSAGEGGLAGVVAEGGGSYKDEEVQVLGHGAGAGLGGLVVQDAEEDEDGRFFGGPGVEGADAPVFGVVYLKVGVGGELVELLVGGVLVGFRHGGPIRLVGLLCGLRPGGRGGGVLRGRVPFRI